jgi:1,4-dihydroxy-2-naphthoyl-CoA synthase
LSAQADKLRYRRLVLLIQQDSAMIDVKTQDGIATVTMRHGKANALDITLCEGLADCFDKLRTSDARAVVLTGQGHIFSAGVDLLQVSAGGADYIRRFLPMLHRMYEAVFFHPKPLVAAVNGHAIAGGCVLACCLRCSAASRSDRIRSMIRVHGLFCHCARRRPPIVFSARRHGIKIITAPIRSWRKIRAFHHQALQPLP